MTMDEDVLKSGSALGLLDAEELAGAIRRLAIKAHQTLKCPDSTAGELIALRRRLKELLRRLADPQAGINRWLRRADHSLEARLLWARRTERESLAS
jgi:hypothetical protein